MGKIIIADPNNEDQLTLAKLLAELNIDDEAILFAKDGHEVLDMLDKHHVILVFIEWEMPELNGIELLKQIKRKPHLTHIPFIMHTNVKEGEKVRLALTHGISGYLIKPVIKDNLKKNISEIIKQKSIKLPMRNVSEDEAIEKKISSLNEFINDLNLETDKSHIIIVSEDTQYWNNYIKKSESREVLKFGYYNKISDAVKLIKSRTPALVMLDYHYGDSRIKSMLEELESHITAHDIPIILCFDNATALHKISSEKENLYRDRGVVELFDKESSFKKLYEKLGKVYVAWNTTIEKLGKLIYIDPMAASYVEYVKETKKKREKRKEDALNSGDVGIIVDPSFGFQFQVLPGIYLDPNQLKFQAILDLIHKRNYPTRFIIDFKNYNDKKIAASEIEKMLSFTENVEAIKKENLTFVVSQEKEELLSSLKEYSAEKEIKIFNSIDDVKDFYFELEQKKL